MHHLDSLLGLLMSSVINESIVLLEVKASDLSEISELLPQVILTCVVMQLSDVDLREGLRVGVSVVIVPTLVLVLSVVVTSAVVGAARSALAHVRVDASLMASTTSSHSGRIV
jgi:hypothetical protein